MKDNISNSLGFDTNSGGSGEAMDSDEYDPLDEDLINEAVKLLTPIVERDGSARVGWVLSQDEILGSGYLKNAPTHLHKIAGKMCAEGEYKPYFMGCDCWIHKNHEFKLNENVKSTNETVKKYSGRTWWLNLLIGICVAGGILVQIIELQDKLQDKSLQESNTQLKHELHTKDSTVSSLQRIIQKDDSLRSTLGTIQEEK